MTMLFTAVRALLALLQALKAAVGIMLVAHGAYQWAKKKKAAAAA